MIRNYSFKGKNRMLNKLVNKNLIISLLLFLTLPVLNIIAQTKTDSTITLTLDKAISIALANNRDIQLSIQDVKNASAQIDEAYADVWPSINFTGDYARNIKLPVLFIPPNTPFNPSPNTETFSLGAKNSYNLGVTLNQTLFSLKVNKAIQIAGDYSDYFKTNETSTKQDIVFQVKQTFYSILLAQKLVEVSQKGYDVAKANYDNVEKLYQQGVSSEYDFLRAEVQLANVEPALIESKNNLKLAKNSLKNLLALDLKNDLNIVGEFKLEEISKEKLAESDSLLIKNNPTLEGLKLQESILDKNISLQTAGYFPTLAAYANYTWQTQDNTFHFSNYNWANTFTVGLRLSVPIFDGFRRSAQIQQAEINKDKVGLTKMKVEEGLKIQLQQSELKMKEAKERVTAQEKSVQQAERALKIAQTRYNNGIGTQLEILDTQSALTQTQTNYAKAIFDFLIAKAQWEKTIGQTKYELKNNNE